MKSKAISKYTGVVDKIRRDVFEDNVSAGSYALMGAAAGAVTVGTIGGITGEGFLSSGITGGITGAGLGFATNKAPKAIMNQLKRVGVKPLDNINDIRDEALTQFQATYKTVNDDQFKESLKLFKPISERNAKNIGDSYQFSKGVMNDFVDSFDNMTQQDLDNFMNFGKVVGNDLDNFSQSSAGTALGDWLEDSGKKFMNLSTVDQHITVANLSTKAGFDSAYSHIVEPTQRVLQGKPKEGLDYLATAVSAYGLYEVGTMAHDISEGEWTSALGTAAWLGVGKVLYSQGVNAYKMHTALKEKGMTYSGLANSMKVGIGMKQLQAGMKQWTPEDYADFHSKVASKMSNHANSNMQQATMTNSVTP